MIGRYNVDIRHIAGIDNKAADTLSRLNVLDGEEEDFDGSVHNEEEVNREMENVHGHNDENEDDAIGNEDWANDYALDDELMEFCFHA